MNKYGIIFEDDGEGQVRIEAGALTQETLDPETTPHPLLTSAGHLFIAVSEFINELTKEKDMKPNTAEVCDAN